MRNMRIANTNNWDNEDYILVPSTEHPSFLRENTRQRWKTRPWRTKYGVNSGWGQFVITAFNSSFHFNEGAGQITATITNGIYNSDSLAYEIETKMEAIGTHLYTVLYNDVTNKFEIYDDTSTVILKLSNTTTAIWDVIGFITGVDTASLSSHIADYVRIHTYAIIKIDSGSGNTIDFRGVWIYHHNISITGTVSVQASDDNFVTTPYSVTMTKGDDMLCAISAILNKYRYLRFYIVDKDNSDGYIEFGRCWVADWFEPEKPFNPKNNPTPKDPSLINESEGGQISAIRREGYNDISYAFDIVTHADKQIFDSIFSELGKHSELVILAKKPNNTTSDFEEPEKYSYYCRFTKFKWSKVAGLLYGLKIAIREER